MVLFGGIGNGKNNFLADTWTYNGTTWAQQTPTASPPPRELASMAYDPATAQMLLVGGYNGSSSDLADTCTYNGTTWTLQSPATSPPARYGASMANDPATAQMVLFGGYTDSSGGSSFADAWAYDGTSWTQQIPATSPPARYVASMAYDPATGQMVLFGGVGNSYFADTWTFGYPPGTTNNWVSQSPTASPHARDGASMAYDPATGQMVLFGGVYYNSSGIFGDTWAYNGTTWTQQFPTHSPPARYSASMAYDPATAQMILFGGYGNTDTWAYNGTTWTQQSPTASPP